MLKDIMPVPPPTPWWVIALPWIIVGVVILGIFGLIVLGLAVSRRLSLSAPKGGVIALTLASMMLLSGLWCMFLSPTVTYSETKDSVYRSLTIDGKESWTYTFSANAGDFIEGSVNSMIIYNMSEKTLQDVFSVYTYNPLGAVIWSEVNVTGAYFSLKASTSGDYETRVYNPSTQPIRCNFSMSIRTTVTYRTLEPFGSWLSLVSLPVFGLGMWGSGLYRSKSKENRKEGSSSV